MTLNYTIDSRHRNLVGKTFVTTKDIKINGVHLKRGSELEIIERKRDDFKDRDYNVFSHDLNKGDWWTAQDIRNATWLGHLGYEYLNGGNGKKTTRDIYENEWKKLMNEAIKESNVQDIAFLWDKLDEINQKGYFTVPF